VIDIESQQLHQNCGGAAVVVQCRRGRGGERDTEAKRGREGKCKSRDKGQQVARSIRLSIDGSIGMFHFAVARYIGKSTGAAKLFQ